MLNIVMLVAPGSGKGTQSDYLIKTYGLFHISTGDVLRDNIKRGTELGSIAKGYIDQGQLIPDDLMIDIYRERIRQNGALLVDASPLDFEKFLKRCGNKNVEFRVCWISFRSRFGKKKQRSFVLGYLPPGTEVK